MINKAYSILMCGELLPVDHKYYRYSDYSPTSNQRRIARKLVPSELEQRAIFAEYVLKLVSCSDSWVDYVQNIDPVNTYSTEVLDSDARLNIDPLRQLADWEGAHELGAEVQDTDPVLDRIITKLFILLG